MKKRWVLILALVAVPFIWVGAALNSLFRAHNEFYEKHHASIEAEVRDRLHGRIDPRISSETLVFSKETLMFSKSFGPHLKFPWRTDKYLHYKFSPPLQNNPRESDCWAMKKENGEWYIGCMH